MRKGTFLLFYLMSLPLACALSEEAQPRSWNRPAQSLAGPTGYVTLPSSEVDDYKNLSFAIHRFGLGLLYSWPRNVEYGFSFDLKEITTASADQSRRAVSPNAKIRLLNSRKWGGIAAGFHQKTYYGVYTKQLGAPFVVEGGGSVTNFAGVNTGTGFFAMAYTSDLSRYMVELDGRSLEPGAGWRYMLASNIAIDLAWTNMRELNNKFDNFSFGLTILWGSS